MNGSKHLTMGFCAPQRFSQLSPFIASLRHTAFAGDVCLLVESVTADIVEQLRAHGVIVERAAFSARPRMTPMASRYFGFLDTLIRHGAEYGKVMLIDPSSVIFQSDPFAASLPADIVYTGEHRRIGEAQALHDAMVQAYGEGVAHNVRDCLVASPAATIGTLSGMLAYLAAMTGELAGRTPPVSGAADQAVHNYVAHMHPLRHAWLDPGDTIAVALHTVRDDAVACTDQGVLTNGKIAPVLSHWDANAKVVQYVMSAPRFQADASMRGAWPSARSEPPPPPPEMGTDAVVAFYQRQRDANWLALFLGSLRCVSEQVAIHCVGDFDPQELAILARHRCTAHRIPATEPTIAENIAHLYLSPALDGIAATASGPPDQVLVMDCMRAIFPRDPFLTKTIGLSVFCEGPTRICDSDYNRDRLALFVPPEASRVPLPVVSSTLMRGTLPTVREFYRRLYHEIVARPELLSIHKVVQGAVNKLCRLGDLGFPVTVHPNGAEVYFDFWPSGLAVDTRHGVRIGGTVPGVVLAGDPDTSLMRMLRIDLGLAEA